MGQQAGLRCGSLPETAPDGQIAGRTLESAVVAAWDAPPLAVHAESRTTDTSVIELPGGGRVVRKRWRWPGRFERLKGVGRTTALAPAPAEREFAALQSEAGGLHPRPIAWATWRANGLLERCLLLVNEVVGAQDLASWLRDERDPALRRAVLTDLARRVAAMHAAGVVDGDMHPRNVLVQAAAARVWKIDCARQRRRLRAPRTDVVLDLACLDVGLRHFASPRERARACITYWPRAGRHALARKIELVRQRLAPDEERRLPCRPGD